MRRKQFITICMCISTIAAAAQVVDIFLPPRFNQENEQQTTITTLVKKPGILYIETNCQCSVSKNPIVVQKAGPIKIPVTVHLRKVHNETRLITHQTVWAGTTNQTVTYVLYPSPTSEKYEVNVHGNQIELTSTTDQVLHIAKSTGVQWQNRTGKRLNGTLESKQASITLKGIGCIWPQP